MAERGKLHMNKLNEFTALMESWGWKQEPIKGDFEVLRLRSLVGELVIFFKRIGSVHVTAQSDSNGPSMIDAYLNERRSK